MDNDEILVEDYKVFLDRMREAEKIILKWERTFLLVNGVIFSLFVQILMSDYSMKQFMICICSAIGILISLLWYFIQARAYLYTRIREFHLNNIETQIRKLKPDIFTFAWFQDVENYKKQNKVRLWQKVSTYWLRTFFPFLIFLLWVSLAIMNFFICF